MLGGKIETYKCRFTTKDSREKSKSRLSRLRSCRPHRDLQRRLMAHIELEILLVLYYNWLFHLVYE